MSSNKTPLTKQDYEKAFKFLHVVKKRIAGLKLDLLAKEQRHAGIQEFSEIEEANVTYEITNENPFDSFVSNTVLLNALNQLTEKEQRTLILHYRHNLSLTEIAKKDGVSTQAVSKNKQRALDKMRHILEEDWYG